MNGAFERLIAPIYRYEGTLARLMGDAIFAFFGAPIAHEDDPQRAVAAGLDIVGGDLGLPCGGRGRARPGPGRPRRHQHRPGHGRAGRLGPPARVHGDGRRRERRGADGADRRARHGAGHRRRRTGWSRTFFDLESRGRVEVKGKSEPVLAYRVARPQGGFATGGAFARRRPPLVGREREIGILEDAIEEAQSGRGRFVSLIGEAGLGKCRLIEETRSRWTRRRPEDSAAQAATSTASGRPGSASPTTRPGRTRSTAACWRGSPGSRTRTRPAPSATSSPPRSSPTEPEWLEPAHARLALAVRRHRSRTRSRSRGRRSDGRDHGAGPRIDPRLRLRDPRLLVFEDLHWCDEASMDVLIETAKLVDELPCLFLFAYRPDRQAPSWRLKQWLETEYPHRSTEIALSPLSDAGQRRADRRAAPVTTATARAEPRSSSAPRATRCSSRRSPPPSSNGTDEGRSRSRPPCRRCSPPGSTRSTRPSRADAAARLGDRPLVPRAGPARGSGRRRRPRLRLRTLERIGPDQPRPPGLARAASTRSTTASPRTPTYGTILLRAGASSIGGWARSSRSCTPNRIEEFAPLLARHFQEAGDDERTLRYATVAGDNAARLYANAEAATHYATAIEAAVRLGQTERVAPPPVPEPRPGAGALADATTRRSRTTRRWQLLARGAGDRSAVLAAEMALTTLHATPTPKFDAERGRALSERTLALARELGDRRRRIQGAVEPDDPGRVRRRRSPRGASTAGERSLAIARELNAREQIAFTLNDLWRPYAAVGDLAASRACLRGGDADLAGARQPPDAEREPREHRVAPAHRRRRCGGPRAGDGGLRGSPRRSATRGARRTA